MPGDTVVRDVEEVLNACPHKTVMDYLGPPEDSLVQPLSYIRKGFVNIDGEIFHISVYVDRATCKSVREILITSNDGTWISIPEHEKEFVEYGISFFRRNL